MVDINKIDKKRIFDFYGSSVNPKENREETFQLLIRYVNTLKEINKIKRNIKNIYLLMKENDIYQIKLDIITDNKDEGYYVDVDSIVMKDVNGKIKDFYKLRLECSLINVDLCKNKKNLKFDLNNIDKVLMSLISEDDLNLYNEIENYEKNLLNEAVDKNINVNKKVKLINKV